ncbi:MAG: UDP-N-acetylmuramoyl-tripeptide--D-alanyl-D-alanine ligase [Longimicrobiales bacterium]
MMGAYVWTDERVRAALGLPVDSGGGERPFTRVSTDSRNVEAGELFVALEGGHFDGHDYVVEALEKGASAAVVSRSLDRVDPGAVYEVDDTLVALGRLASHRRVALNASIVAITGSSGKTGTKDLTRGALEGSLRVHATYGNLNNRIGLPMTLLAAPDEAEVVVLEMGTNEPGEIGALAVIAEAQIGVITTISETHLEKLESLDGVLTEKLSLLRGLAAGGQAVVGDEPSELPDAARKLHPTCRVAGWTDGADADLRPDRPEMDLEGCWGFHWKGHPVSLEAPGRHTVRNAMLALTVADMLDVAPDRAAEGVSRVQPTGMRGEVRRLGGLSLILDCYNANPQSTRAAVDLLADLSARERVLFLGTMLELGDHSDELHHRVLSYACAGRVETVVATGEFAKAARSDPALQAWQGLLVRDDPEVAYADLRSRLEGDEIVLLKASRGVELERLVPMLEEDFGTSPPVDAAGRA